MKVTVIPAVHQIFNLVKTPGTVIVKRADGSLMPIEEYVKLPSFDTISETPNNLLAEDGKVVIELVHR